MPFELRTHDVVPNLLPGSTSLDFAAHLCSLKTFWKAALSYQYYSIYTEQAEVAACVYVSRSQNRTGLRLRHLCVCLLDY